MPKKKYVDDESDHEASDDGGTSVESTGNLAPLLKMDIKKQIILCSKTMSGKSHLFCSLLYHLAKKGAFNQCPTQIVVFCGSSETCDDYNSILPKHCVRRGFDEQTCLKIIKLHKQQILLKRKQSIRSSTPTKMKHLILILEDCIGCSCSLTTSPALRYLATSGRHIYCSLWISSQSSVDALSPTLRLNASTILWSNLSQDHLKYIWSCTQGMTWKEFLAFSKMKRFEFGMYDNSLEQTGFHKVSALPFPKGKFHIKSKDPPKQKTKDKDKR